MPELELASQAAGSSVAPSAATSLDVCATLCRAAASEATGSQFLQDALETIGVHFRAVYGVLRTDEDGRATVLEYRPRAEAAAPWRRACQGMMLRVKRSRAASAEAIRTESGLWAILAVPFAPDGDDVLGGLAIVAACDEGSAAEARLAELNSLAALVGVASDRSETSSTPAAMGGAAASIAKAAACENLSQFAYALVNDLHSRLGCDQVSLGWVRKRNVELLAVSGIEEAACRHAGAKIVRDAMNECLDAGETLTSHSSDGEDDAGPDGHFLHRRWRRETDDAVVATLPLRIGEAVVAVLALRNPPGRPFPPARLQAVRKLVEPFTPGMRLLDRAEQPIARRLLTAGDKAFRQSSMMRRVAAAAALGIGLWLAFGTTPYVVATPAVVAPAERRVVSAPFEGAIAAVHVRPGDHVRAGEAIAALDAAPLESKQAQLLAELHVAEVDLATASNRREPAAAAQAKARADAATAELAALRYKLDRAQLRAPADGVVLSGDLQPRLGEVVPLGEPLLELSGSDAWRVEAFVPEHAAFHLVPGQRVQFAALARPDQKIEGRVTSLDASATVHQGRNVFVASIEIAAAPPAWFLDGMEGVAQIDAGRRRAGWVWLHRIGDRLRIEFWKL